VVSLPVPPRPDVDDVDDVATTADGRPKATWGGGEAIVVWLVANLVVGGILVYAVFDALLDLDDAAGGGGADNDVLLVSAAIALVTTALVIAWLRARHPRWRDTIAIHGGVVALRHAAWGAVAGLILYTIVALGVGLIVVVVLEAFAEGRVDTPEQLAPGLDATGRVFAVVYGFGIAPFAEEFFFRGVLFRGIADRRGFWPAALISGVTFGLVHLPVGEPLADALVLPLVMTFTGIGLAWIYERRGSLWAPVAAHMVFNAIGLVLIFSGVGG
jgi:membrane protease YdiL (CAAX protease family)